MSANGNDREDFVGEAIRPKPVSFDAAGMARGEPGLPAEFTWRDKSYCVAKLVSTWKTSSRGPCGELYLRRHWYAIETTEGERMTLYCDRQAKDRSKPKARWWLYSRQSDRLPRVPDED